MGQAAGRYVIRLLLLLHNPIMQQDLCLAAMVVTLLHGLHGHMNGHHIAWHYITSHSCRVHSSAMLSFGSNTHILGRCANLWQEKGFCCIPKAHLAASAMVAWHRLTVHDQNPNERRPIVLGQPERLRKLQGDLSCTHVVLKRPTELSWDAKPWSDDIVNSIVPGDAFAHLHAIWIWIQSLGNQDNAALLQLLKPGAHHLQESCSICFDEFKVSDMHAAPCSHFFCRGCWKGYVHTAISGGPAVLNLRCPLPDCSAAVGLLGLNLSCLLFRIKVGDSLCLLAYLRPNRTTQCDPRLLSSPIYGQCV